MYLSDNRIFNENIKFEVENKFNAVKYNCIFKTFIVLIFEIMVEYF